MHRHAFSIFLLLAATFLCVTAAVMGGDFDVYLDAASKLKEGENIYHPPFINGLQYYYSVFFALLLIPFAGWGWVIRLLWLVLSMLMLYRSFVLLRNHLDFKTISPGRYRLWAFLVVLLSYQFIHYNISMIQVTFLLLWAMLESLTLVQKKKELTAGSLLGLSVNIKIMPVIFLAYLFYRRHIYTVITAVLSFIALIFLPSLLIGHDFNLQLLQSWWEIINPSNKEHLFETGNGTHSLVALIPVYLTETTGALSVQRNILDLPHDQVIMIINLARLALLALSVAYLRPGIFREGKSSLQIIWEASYFMLLIPLLLPHQQKYAFLLAMPVAAYILYYFISLEKKETIRKHGWCLGVFGVSALLFSPLYGSAIIGRYAFDWVQHFRLLTFAVLLLIPVSLYCSPHRLKKLKSEHL